MHQKDLLAAEGQINDAMVGAMEQLALIPGMMLDVAREPIGIVPRLGSFVTTSAHAVKNIAFHKKDLAAFLDAALERVVLAPGRAATDPPRILLLHLANILACAGAASGTAWSGLRVEIDRAAALGWETWKPFRKSDTYTPALAAIALRHPKRTDVVARTPRLGATLASPASDLDRFLALAIEGATQDAMRSAYEDLMMFYIVDFASDYPAPDDLANEDGARFFDPNTMLWVARIYHAVAGGLSVGGVVPRLREDLRAFTGLRD